MSGQKGEVQCFGGVAYRVEQAVLKGTTIGLLYFRGGSPKDANLQRVPFRAIPGSKSKTVLYVDLFYFYLMANIFVLCEDNEFLLHVLQGVSNSSLLLAQICLNLA